MTNLSAYLPQDRLRALARNEALPDRAIGSALFADISGFTPLTERLTRELGARHGAEELTKQINAVFDALIAEVERYGGSVISFAGDAMICWFESQGEASSLLLHAEYLSFAIGCAFALQTAMSAFPQLALKVALASGPARRFVVGDSAIQQLDLLAGATLDRVAAAEQLTNKGEVVADEASWQAWGAPATPHWRAHATGERFAVLTPPAKNFAPSSALNPTRTELPAPLLRRWLLPGVYERLQAGFGGFLTELRPITTLFIKFTGLEYDTDEAAGQKLDTYIQWVQRVLQHYEGTLLQITMGDKGSYAQAVFGALTAHEDDARRAVQAALELCAPPPALNFIQACQIGVSRGTTLTGAYGGATRCTYGVMGDEVNLAARLMQVAQPGEVIVSGRVQTAAADFEFETRPPIQVRGKTAPVPIFRPLRARARVGGGNAATTLVGRVAEQAQLATGLEQVARGVSGVMILEGEAGLGKSRLIEALQAQAAVSQLRCLIGWAEAIETMTAYHAWRPILAQLLAADTLDHTLEARRAQVLARLTELDPQFNPALAPLLNTLLPCDFPETLPTQPLQGEGRAHRTRSLVCQLLRASGRGQPLVVILEDTHWLDSASWKLARLITEELHPVLLVITTRPMPEPTPLDYHHLLQHAHLTHVRLEQLAPEDVAQLVRLRLETVDLPEAVTRFIQAQSEGNPFFSEELAYALRDAGLLRVTAGVCELVANFDAQRITFPDTVQGVIASRIDRLTPQAQFALKVMSVIGRMFGVPLLTAVCSLEAERANVPEVLEALRQVGLIETETAGLYVFKHSLIQQVAYDLMLQAQRRKLHQAVAEWYEQHAATSPDAYYPLLAYHWDKALMPAKALAYFEQAGEQTLRNGVYREAIDYFLQALRCLPEAGLAIPPAREASWLRAIGLAYFSLGQPATGQTYFLRALNVLQQPPPGEAPRLPPRIALENLRSLWALWRPVRQTLPNAHPAREAARVYQHLSQTYVIANELLPAVYSVYRGLNVAERAGPSAELAWFCASATVGYRIMGNTLFADVYYRRAQTIARQIQDEAAQASVYFLTSMFNIGFESWPVLQEHLEWTVEFFKRQADRRNWGDTLNFLGLLLWYRGQYDQLFALSRELSQLGQRSGNPEHYAYGLALQAMAHFRRHQLEAARQLYAEALPILTQTSRAGEIVANSFVQLIELQLGPSSATTHLADTVLAHLQKNPPASSVLFDCYANVAETYLTLWQQANPPEATLRQRARAACQALSAFARTFPLGRARAALYQGWLEELSGHPEAARKAWAKSLRLAHQLEMPYEIELARARA